MDTIAKVATAMQTVLTTTADQAARATGCVQRVREFTGATFVQTLVFGWLDDPDASLAQLCQVAATRGVTITPQGLAPRFTEQAAACLQQVLEAALRVVIASEPAALPLLDRFAAVVVRDSTIVCLPDALAERWPGGGGGSATGAGTQAALKLQVGLNLRDGTMPHFSLHPGRVQDQAAAPDPAARPADTLVLTDLGYFDRDRLAAHAAAGQHWVLVPKANALVQGPGQPRGTVAARRRRVPPTQAVVDAPVALGASHRLPCRLVAVRAHPQLVARRRRQLRKAARKKGQPVSADQWTLAAWTAYVTTVPAERASVAEVRVLGRVRWQVEVVFKRWKSLGRSMRGAARSRGASCARCTPNCWARSSPTGSPSPGRGARRGAACGRRCRWCAAMRATWPAATMTRWRCGRCSPSSPTSSAPPAAPPAAPTVPPSGNYAGPSRLLNFMPIGRNELRPTIHRAPPLGAGGATLKARCVSPRHRYSAHRHVSFQ